MDKFVIDEIKTISVIYSKCPACGFENPKEEMLHICPNCNTNLVVMTTKGDEPFCSFALE